MKKMSFILASLLAITLLSCNSHDNSSEDANYPQANVLDKEVLASAAVAATTGSAKLTSSTCGVISVPVGSYAWSCEKCFNFTIPPEGCTITNITFCPGAVATNKGTFTISYLEISNDDYYTRLNWNGTGCVSTTAFNGLPARNEFCASFYGKCTYGYYEFTSVYVPQCNKSYSGGNMTLTYHCP
jgi:hypothetical protein